MRSRRAPTCCCWCVRDRARLLATTVDRRSLPAPLALACSVAAALPLHIPAILLPLALTAGEAVEFLRTRLLRVACHLAAPRRGAIACLYPILLRASKTVIFGGPAYAPTPDKLYAAFRSDVPRPRVVVAVVAATLVAGWWARRRAREQAHTAEASHPAEFAVFCALLASPARALSLRYCQRRRVHDAVRRFRAASAGRSHWRAAFCYWRRPATRGPERDACGTPGRLAVLSRQVTDRRQSERGARSLTASSGLLDADVPLVLVNPVDVLAFDDQATDAERARAVYVADSTLALKYTGTNGIDLGYERGEPFLNVGVRRVSVRRPDERPLPVVSAREMAGVVVVTATSERRWVGARRERRNPAGAYLRGAPLAGTLKVECPREKLAWTVRDGSNCCCVADAESANRAACPWDCQVWIPSIAPRGPGRLRVRSASRFRPRSTAASGWQSCRGFP